jgi:hypothetical protein
MADALVAQADEGTLLTIPVVEGRAHTTQRINLDGRVYTLVMKWNEGQETWYLSLYDSEESPIVQGLRIVSNWPLLRYYHFDTRTPPGELYAQDLTGDGSPPGFDDFGIGKRVELTYYAQNAS